MRIFVLPFLIFSTFCAAKMQLGVETAVSPLSYWTGMYSPGGTLNVGVLRDSNVVAMRHQLGIDYNLDYHYAFSLEKPYYNLASDVKMGPFVGASVVYSPKFQRLTDAVPVETFPEGETWDRYEKADYAFSFYTSLGVRLYSASSVSWALGYSKQQKFVAKNFREVNIRNCYVDKCGNSAGGAWPPPAVDVFLTLNWNFRNISM